MSRAAGPFANYAAYFDPRFRTTVLWRTMEIALITTLVSIAIGCPAAWVIARSPGRMKSILIIADLLLRPARLLDTHSGLWRADVELAIARGRIGAGQQKIIFRTVPVPPSFSIP